jgi:hypothetical protein
MIDYDSLLPEPEIMEGIRSSIRITTQPEMDMIVRLCMAVKAWGFDPRFMRASSAKWAYSTFGCEEYDPHGFFKYYLDEIKLVSFSIIECTGIGPQIDKVTTYQDIRSSMHALFPDVEGVFEIPEGLIKTILREYVAFMRDDPVIYNKKKATEIYKGIGYAKEAQSNACVRSVRSSVVEYEYIDNIYIEPTYHFLCEYCGETVPCIQSTSNSICRNCLAKQSHDKNNADCCHIECRNYGCVHYLGETQDDYVTQR